MRHRLLAWSLLLVVASALLWMAGCSGDSSSTTDSLSDLPDEQASTVPPADDAAAATASPSGEAAAPIDNTILAWVNEVPITTLDFEQAKQQVLAQYQQIYSQFGQDVRSLLGGAQGRLFDLRLSDEALEQATTRAIVIGELANQNASIPDQHVDAEFRRQFDAFLDYLGMDEATFKAEFEGGTLQGFQTGGVGYDQFIGSARQSIQQELEIKAVQDLIAGTIEPTTNDLIAFFAEHRSNYNTAEQVRASHILVSDEATAQQLINQLDAGADFAALAQEYSTDTGSAARGGDLGWFERGRMVEAFEEAAFSTPVGAHSGIVVTEYGYHIITVADHQSAHTPEYEEVAERVIADYETSVKSQRFTDWYSIARPAASIEITDPILDAYRKQQEDLDLGLAAFLALQSAGTTDDPYLGYMIGSIYETKMDEALSKKRGIEANEPLSPSQQAQIAQLDTQIAAFRNQAVAAYQASLRILGSEPEIKARVENLTVNDSQENDPTVDPASP